MGKRNENCNNMKKICFILLLLLVISKIQAQLSILSNKDEFLNRYDLSSLWRPSTIVGYYDVVDKESTIDLNIKRPEPIGFIGDNYQRFYIHFTSVIKNKKSANEYFVVGKTKVRDNIYDFQGTITILHVECLDTDENLLDFQIKQGVVLGEYLFYEDKKQKGTGIFEGNFQTDIFLDPQLKLYYDAIYLDADGYSNNQFSGTWRSYKTSAEKICNWGDYRIPRSMNLDIGAGEFHPDRKYYQFGWDNYEYLFEDTPQGERARKIEKYEWWK